MENSELTGVADNTETKKIEIKKISTTKFIILCVITLGIYNIWWIYKAWRFFKLKEGTAINPILRTILSIVFLIPLFNKILNFAKSYGYKKDYESILLFISFFIVNILGDYVLPFPYYLVTLISFIFLIPPFNALNYAIDHCEDIQVNVQDKFNIGQKFLIIIGSIIWILLMTGLLFIFVGMIILYFTKGH